VKVTRSSTDDGAGETLIRTLERGEFFGERALQSCVCIILISINISITTLFFEPLLYSI